ncbi:MAG: UbiX family flavin prenyltransferase [Bacillota bacterium]|nr:UbiX family flavin prenyltransferase [Bacillota bacterium]
MKRIIVAVTGASGIPLAITCLEELRKNHCEIHLIVSSGAKQTLAIETKLTYQQMIALADVIHDNQNIGDNIASGTYPVDGIIVIPCSMKTLSAIRNGYDDCLINRAVDVNIKEQRPVILVPREAPLSPIHLDHMAFLSRLPRVFIIPAMLTYYNQPTTIKDMEIHLTGKILDKFGLQVKDYRRWNG